jgi:hypothetical protein
MPSSPVRQQQDHRQAACLFLLLMVPSQMKIDPGRGIIQFPHPGRHKILCQGMSLLAVLQADIGPDPYALPVRVHLAESVPGTAAGPVPDVLGTAGFRAQKRHMLNGAVSTSLAGEQRDLQGILQYPFESPFGQRASVYLPGPPPEPRGQTGRFFKKHAMGSP